MPFTVTTGGPVGGGSPDGPTFGDMIDAIADDVDDTTGEYGDAIQRAIKAAIRYCEREPYYFNESRDVTFSTVSGQEWYDYADNDDIGTLVRIVAAYSEDASGQRTLLSRAMPEDIELLADNGSSRGEPYCFTYFDQRVRLYPIPGATVYTIRLQLGPYRLWTLSDTTDTNSWLDEAYDMIKARAKYILHKDTLKDASLAAEALNDFNDQEQSLKAETSRRSGRGRIVCTAF
ncbi:MAG: hypothetical protein E5Y67_12365 [Mesorhizobium sp.]|uniref:phage adaptor protein n=1 Tax=Mesorhizobium sp. TaxID=1871066 RepID=UPI0012091E9C|nr:hypothetical protein [Mesorhizobium sp.]TIM14466.1 MAG: hypothetical protein E5Y67_12365 [Mesorhizobium sp.]